MISYEYEYDFYTTTKYFQAPELALSILLTWMLISVLKINKLGNSHHVFKNLDVYYTI